MIAATGKLRRTGASASPSRTAKREDCAPPLRIGISSCLLGEEVRYDGGHKRDAFLADVLGPFVEWVRVCPEVEAGFGVPREAMRLERRGRETRLVATRSGTDLTVPMRRFAAQRARELAALDLSGYVLKKSSPSYGLERVEIYGGGGAVASGSGLFAEALRGAIPHLPVEDEGRLCDPALRENFIERIFAYRRLRTHFAGRWTAGSLAGFHAAHELQLMAHSPQLASELGRLVAEAKSLPRAELRNRYASLFMTALETQATPRRHANVLRQVAGYFRKNLDAQSRGELAGMIDDYAEGAVPLIVPLTLLRNHGRRLGVSSLQGQTYLEPDPKELLLRSRV